MPNLGDGGHTTLARLAPTWVDPKEKLFAMFLTQTPGLSLDPLRLLARQQVYGGLK